MINHLYRTINFTSQRLLHWAVVALVLCTVSASQSALAAQVTATVDRHDISIEETLNLKIRYQGKKQSSIPDLDDLEKNFDILSQSRSNQFRSFNGQVEAWVEWSLVIAPKSQGELLIPSFNIEGDFTTPIKIQVNEAKPLSLGSGEIKDIFLETEIDQSDVYVQQQVLLTLRLNTALPVASINQRETLDLSEAKVEEISEQRYNRTIDGRDFAVLELVFAIYPQESGQLNIPVMTWEANIGNRSSSLFDLYSRQNSLRRLRSEAQTINVKPKPANYVGDHWLPAKKMAISESWSDGFPEFVQGEPITRSITLMADGLTASQLPTLVMDYPQNINQYPESPKVDEQKSNQGILTNSVQTQALLVTQAGEYILPAINIAWWNTTTNQEEAIQLPERKIVVAGSKALAPPPPITPSTPILSDDQTFAPPESAQSNGIHWGWLLLSNVITAGIIGLALGWYFTVYKAGSKAGNIQLGVSSSGSKRPNRALLTLVKELEQQCQEQNAEQTRHALIAISNLFSSSGNGSLNTLIAHSQDQEFNQAIDQLDRALYNPSASNNINFAALAAGAQKLTLPQDPTANGSLAPLNPASM